MMFKPGVRALDTVVSRDTLRHLGGFLDLYSARIGRA
jgi:hypothetical protein